jgi:hypothetical protein
VRKALLVLIVVWAIVKAMLGIELMYQKWTNDE